VHVGLTGLKYFGELSTPHGMNWIRKRRPRLPAARVRTVWTTGLHVDAANYIASTQ